MKDNFCLQPWIGIHAWPDGRVYPCCMYSFNEPLGNLNEEPIEQLVNNDNFKKLRQQLLNNEQPTGCRRCYELEETGSHTLRQTTTTHRFRNLVGPIKKNQTLESQDIKYLDVRFSNVCNFKCRTCGPELSSKWGADIAIIKNIPDTGVISIPREQFWNFYEKALETAEEIVFAGGEALMQDEHYAALNKLIELNKTDVALFYTTNLSTLKYKQIDLFELWKKFENIKIYASLDAMGPRAEYIRHGTDWNKIVENRKKLLELPNIDFNITPTISLFNAWHFPDFHRHWIEEGYLNPHNVRINILTHPLTQQANLLRNKEIVIEKWENHIKWLEKIIDFGPYNYKTFNSNYYFQQFYSVINFLKTEPDDREFLEAKFRLVNKPIDNIRKERLTDVFPEFQQLMPGTVVDSKTFCVFPFFNLNSNTDGSVKLCCNIRDNVHIKDDAGVDFNLGKDPIQKIWNSAYLKDVRKKMLSGQEVSDCSDCYKHEKLTGSSSRTQSNKQWLENSTVKENIEQFVNTGKPPKLSSLELRLGNTCNLTCNSCWGYSSSRSNDERLKLLEDPELNNTLKSEWQVEKTIPANINRWFLEDQYQQNILTVSPNLERIYLTGGEPTLIKQNRVLLQNLLDQNNNNCFVSFTTNGTIGDPELLELLKQFPNNEIQISLDGVYDQANYIRYPTDWDVLKTNIESFANIDNINIVFYTVISAYNLYSLADIWNFIDDLAMKRPVRWYPICLDNPAYLHSYIWPREERLRAKAYLEEKMKTLKFMTKYSGQHTFEKVFSYYCSEEEHIDRIPMFVEYNKTLDKHRKTDFFKVFPELQCLI